MTDAIGPSVVLYWLPLGAGGHFVQLNGRIFEALVARLEKRPTKDLYHSALVVKVPETELSSSKHRYVMEAGRFAASWRKAQSAATGLAVVTTEV